jgi:hypothetical protein
LIYGHERHGADSAQLAASGTQLRTADGGVKRIYSELICSEIHGWHTARKTAARATIPNLDALDPKELKALIVSRHELIVSRDSEIKQLKLLIAKLRRMLFRRSSEKLEDRAIGTAARSVAAERCGESRSSPGSNGEYGAGGAAGTAAIASAPATGSANLSSKAGGLPGLRRQAELMGRTTMIFRKPL